MMRYLNVAENVLWNMNPYQKCDLYGIVLHSLVKAKEAHKAVRTFKIMRSCRRPANTTIYNIMIESCKLLPCLKSASALLSLILRDGIYPKVLIFTSLLKVVLAKKGFEGALYLLDICIVERIQPDICFFNTILKETNQRVVFHKIDLLFFPKIMLKLRLISEHSSQGQIHVVEYIV